jgi:hypothetical protein
LWAASFSHFSFVPYLRRLWFLLTYRQHAFQPVEDALTADTFTANLAVQVGSFFAGE